MGNTTSAEGLTLQGYDACRNEDYSRALDCWERAATLGESGGAALYNLGLLYEKGLGVSKDYHQAKLYYEKSGSAEALFNLGLLYANDAFGSGGYSKAKGYFEQAAVLGNIEALNNLGVMYREGLGVDQSNESALTFFEAAAIKGHSQAFTNFNAFASLIGKDDRLKESMVTGRILRVKLQDLHASDSRAPELKKEDEATDASSRDLSCVVCQDSTANHAIVPCGHLCLCISCTQKIASRGQCPICRSEVQSTLRIYMPN